MRQVLVGWEVAAKRRAKPLAVSYCVRCKAWFYALDCFHMRSAFSESASLGEGRIFFMVFKNQSKTYRLAVCSLMTALAVLLGGFLSIPIMIGGGEGARISFMMIPILFVSMTCGPLYGGVTAIAADILKFMIFTRGAYTPAFTITMFIGGFLGGLLFIGHPSMRVWRVFLAALLSQAIQSILLNSILLYIMYGIPLAALWPRWIVAGINSLIFPIILCALFFVCRSAGILIPSPKHVSDSPLSFFPNKPAV